MRDTVTTKLQHKLPKHLIPLQVGVQHEAGIWVWVLKQQALHLCLAENDVSWVAIMTSAAAMVLSCRNGLPPQVCANSVAHLLGEDVVHPLEVGLRDGLDVWQRHLAVDFQCLSHLQHKLCSVGFAPWQ